MPTRSRVRQRTPAPISDSLQGLGERLRKARIDAGLSQAKLAAPHFTRAYVSAVEKGKVRPAMSSLEFLAGKLGKPPSYFLEDEEQERKRAERELDIKAAAALLSRPTAAEALARLRGLLETTTTTSEACRMRLMAATAENFLFRPAEAMKDLAVAERLAAELRDAQLQRGVAHQKALALRLLGDHSRSRDMLAQLLNDVERANPPDRILQMKLLRDLGALCWDLGEYDRANAYYESALSWAREIGDVSGLVAIYNGLGYARRALGDFEGAAAYLQKALGATQVSNDLAAQALLHNALAVIAAERGHLKAAYGHADRAIEIARVNGPESYAAHYMTTKAECALKAGALDEAHGLAQEALAVAERTQNQRAGAAAKVVLGEVAGRTGSHASAIARLEEAAATYRQLGAKQELGDVLMRLSASARDSGQLDLSQRYAEQAYRATRNESGLVGRNT